MVGALIVVAFWFFFVRGQPPDAIAGEGGEQHEVEHFSTSGAGQHVEGTVTYETSPPTHGEHSSTPAPCGVFNEQIPNENIVHTLEHGAVGLLYKPDLELEVIRDIEEVVGDYETHVFSAPYPEMDNPITAVGWANMMRLDAFDGVALRGFVDAFRQGGRAPEAFQTCPSDADAPFDPAPSPSPEPTPSETKKNK